MNQTPNFQPLLQNNLVSLIPLTEQDFARVYQVASDPLVWEQHPASDRYKEDVFREFFNGAMASGSAFVIMDKASNQVIGCTRFYDYKPEAHSIAVGFTFLARQYWGGKYNRAVKTLMLDYAFHYVDKVIFHIGAHNLRSQLGTGKLGVVKTGEFFADGNPEKPSFEYTLFKDAWKINRGGAESAEVRDLQARKSEMEHNGFTTISGIFSGEDLQKINEAISTADTSNETFRKSAGLFAIRQFLKEVPKAFSAIFTDRLLAIIRDLFGENYFVVKSIYFDKPGDSNWFVSYRQDLTLSVDKRVEVEGFGPWSVKQNQFAVQPPISLLEKNFTVRIHLDDTDDQNGALRVIPGSHRKGIYRPETIDWSKEKEVTCQVPQGGIMIMCPLLLHASSRTVNNKKRRVIHIEFSDQILPKGLEWSEYMRVF